MNRNERSLFSLLAFFKYLNFKTLRCTNTFFWLPEVLWAKDEIVVRSIFSVKRKISLLCNVPVFRLSDKGISPTEVTQGKSPNQLRFLILGINVTWSKIP